MEKELKYCNQTIYVNGSGNGTSNSSYGCQNWQLTGAGKLANIPISWCYSSCYAPGGYPLVLNDVCNDTFTPQYCICMDSVSGNRMLQATSDPDVNCEDEKQLIA